LQQEDIPSTRREIFQRVAQVASSETGFSSEIFRLAEGETRPYREELWQITEDYIVQIARLVWHIDHL
jgi:hypothetical protein